MTKKKDQLLPVEVSIGVYIEIRVRVRLVFRTFGFNRIDVDFHLWKIFVLVNVIWKGFHGKEKEGKAQNTRECRKNTVS